MIRDFADWLSPMLVKELRQGMRSRMLTTALFLMQGLLILNAIAGISLAGSGVDQQATTGFFWAILALPLFLLLPGAAMGTIGNEIKANTLELIFLTRLTARRIVLGKWIAIVAQSALLAVTVLPYVALRYYLGGINIAGELLTVVLMLIGSSALTALMVALSSYQSKLVRVFLFLGFFLALQFGTYGIAYLTLGPGGSVLRGGGGITSGWEVLEIAGQVPLLIGLLLESGAARIAPQAENHSGPIRLLVLLLLLTCGLEAVFAKETVSLIIVQVLVLPFCLGALSENVPAVASLYRPFARRGWFGRLAAWFFTPGWHTGTLYTALVLLCLAVPWWMVSSIHPLTDVDAKWLLSLLGYSATLLFPLVVIKADSRKRLMFYLAFIAFTAGAWFVLAILGQVHNNNYELAETVLILPPAAIFAPAVNHFGPSLRLLVAWMAFLNVVALLFFPFKARAAFRETAKQLQEATRQLSHHAA